MERKRSRSGFIALLCSLLFLWGCNDHLLPADNGDIWGSQRIIFTLAMLGGAAYGPIVTMPLNANSPDAAIAHGMLLNPPQGGKIVYSTQNAGSTKLQLLGNGVDRTLAVDDIYSRVRGVATLTPDGNTVAYVLNDIYGASSLNLYEDGGGALTNPVIADIGEVSGMLFSGSGKYLAIGVKPPGEAFESVKIYERSTWQPIALLDNIVLEIVADRYIHWFQWMPNTNDDQILYSGQDYRGNKGLYTVVMNGRVPRKIADGSFSFPAPSPDGRHVAFIRDNNLWLCSIDGTRPQQLTTVVPGAGEQMIAPQWSPDGSKLMVFRVVVAFPNPSAIIDIVDVRTRRRKVLTQSVYPGFWAG